MRAALVLLTLLALPTAGALPALAPITVPIALADPVPVTAAVALPEVVQATATAETPSEPETSARILTPQPVVHPLVELLPEIPVEPPVARRPAPASSESKLERVDRTDALGPRARAELPDARLERAPVAPSLLSHRAPEPAAIGEPRVLPRADEPRSSASDEATRAPPPDTTSWRGVAAAGSAALALALLAPLLYHRLRGKALLSGQRAELLALLAAKPGLTAADAARALGVDPSTAIYHLRILAREHLVTLEGRHYFAAGTTASREERAQHVARRSAAEVLDAVRASPGVNKSAIAKQLAIARGSVAHHLARLEKAGLVRAEKEGRSLRIFPKETLSSESL